MSIITRAPALDLRNKAIEIIKKDPNYKSMPPLCNHEPPYNLVTCVICIQNKLISQFDEWTSGDPFIDFMIRGTQKNVTDIGEYFKWFDFADFKNVKYLLNGGFSRIYSCGNLILKVIPNSHNAPMKFMTEGSFLWLCMKNEITFSLKCLGVTRDPSTRNLRDFLKTASWENAPWKIRLQMLNTISINLYTLHELGAIHRDLHSGNILVQKMHDNHVDAYIADFGQTKYICCTSENCACINSSLYGVIPYIAPELFKCKTHTKASDIYSFGILMWELSSSEPPFINREHDINLIKEICKGLRPEVVPGTPSCYVDLMKRCWDTDPLKRPTMHEIRDITYSWVRDSTYTMVHSDYESFKVADEYQRNNPRSKISQYPSIEYSSLKQEIITSDDLFVIIC
ncbi:kinase-like domain-containing protein [Gigaspora rosea]|uniref:Kinase-like domain-containing protein n=1 Tax=Gigaspora rosea TaxID=44941 RepID=A0A397VFK0_9GLOM|nr:kinase-like domain-containing protein [Gigaspora rosea]